MFILFPKFTITGDFDKKYSLFYFKCLGDQSSVQFHLLMIEVLLKWLIKIESLWILILGSSKLDQEKQPAGDGLSIIIVEEVSTPLVVEDKQKSISCFFFYLLLCKNSKYIFMSLCNEVNNKLTRQK